MLVGEGAHLRDRIDWQRREIAVSLFRRATVLLLCQNQVGFGRDARLIAGHGFAFVLPEFSPDHTAR